jgi:hypothetical protein
MRLSTILPAALSNANAWDLEVFSEYLDLARFPAARYGDDIVPYLRARYATRKPDVLIVVSNITLQFVLDHRDELFPGVPIVFTGIDHREVGWGECWDPASCPRTRGKSVAEVEVVVDLL